MIWCFQPPQISRIIQTGPTIHLLYTRLTQNQVAIKLNVKPWLFIFWLGEGATCGPPTKMMTFFLFVQHTSTAKCMANAMFWLFPHLTPSAAWEKKKVCKYIRWKTSCQGIDLLHVRMNFPINISHHHISILDSLSSSILDSLSISIPHGWYGPKFCLVDFPAMFQYVYIALEPRQANF